MKYIRSDVLCLSENPKAASTVRRHYEAWRVENELPRERCDNTGCHFHTNPLIWNHKRLKMILDHVSGKRRDNSVANLRLLCPNCDSQNTETRGGANAGRTEDLIGGGYHRFNRDGTQDGHAPGATLEFKTNVKTYRAPSARAKSGKNR